MRAVITVMILGPLSNLLLKVIFSQWLDPMAKRQRPLCHLSGHERGQGSPVNDATAASERLTVCCRNRPVNKATRPAELCQWLRGGSCDSKPQVNHAHTHTHTHACSPSPPPSHLVLTHTLSHTLIKVLWFSSTFPGVSERLIQT